MKCTVITLGCKVNAYESEHIKENFKNKGYHIVELNELPDVIVINTHEANIEQVRSQVKKVVRK